MAAPFDREPRPDKGAGGDVLALWAERTGRRRASVPGHGGLRFAFYGRVSTEDWQDPVMSRARQRDQAEALIIGRGVIVAQFFDAGQSRAVAWARRPQAAALVAQLADPGRGVGCDRDRRVRAGVLRRPVCGDGAAVRALRAPAVDAGSGWPGRFRLGA